ncbi:MAG: hypothetical protein PVS3B3_31280 [Ktedonobacteraceae bacterium]
MKIDRQTRTFAKQVQVDLLGLADMDLFQTIQLWTGEGQASYVTQEAYIALGYTRSGDDSYPISMLSTHEGIEAVQWLAPAPQHLRDLLLDMSMPQFVQHVLPLAYESLHILHPEWGEGATFNAHLANHLRALVTKR